MFRNLALLTSAFLALPATWAIPTDDCPILGPIFPHSFDVSQSEVFINATQQFPDVIAQLFEAGLVNETGSAFSIDVFSAETNTSIYSFNHVGSALQDSKQGGEMNDETIFRIGSVSKLVTAYSILAAAGLEVFRDPVTKYIPELEGNSRDEPNELIVWEDVTVGALLSHQAGAGGFPLELFICAVDPASTGQCGFPEYFESLRTQKRPVNLPWNRIAYSDNGYGLLGRVLERITNQTYEESIISMLGEPLGLNGTSSSLPPNGSNIFALQGDATVSSWGLDNVLSEGSGGVYSSGADLRAIGLSVLHSTILSAQDTREWLNPRGHTASLTTSLGSPWEIFRLGLPVSAGSNRTRVSDLYTKAGGQAGYGTIFALSPDHGLGFSINVAGATASTERWILRSAVTESFIVAAELAAAANAASNFAGTYVVPGSGETTNLTLSIDADKPGLGLEAFYVAGADFKLNITDPLGLAGGLIPSENISIRLYPNDIVSASGDVGFYGIPAIMPAGPRSALEGGEGLFDLGCEAWLNLAFVSFQGVWPENFVMNVVEGRAASITYPGANVTLERLEE